jgi:hypothetical protein
VIPISVNVNNLVEGPAVCYAAPFGTTEPPSSAITPAGASYVPPPPWTDVGGTDGGINFTSDATYNALVVDQITMDVGARLAEQKFGVAAKLAEMSLVNLGFAMNSNVVSTPGAGYTVTDFLVGNAATQPNYVALMIGGWGPELATGGAAARWIIIRKVLSAAKITATYDRKTQQAYDLTWTAYFVSQSIAPVRWVDQTQ